MTICFGTSPGPNDTTAPQIPLTAGRPATDLCTTNFIKTNTPIHRAIIITKKSHDDTLTDFITINCPHDDMLCILTTLSKNNIAHMYQDDYHPHDNHDETHTQWSHDDNYGEHECSPIYTGSSSLPDPRSVLPF